MKTSPSPIAPSGVASLTSGVLDLNNFEICKVYSGVVGPPVVFNITVDVGNNGSVNETFSRTLSNGQCAELHTTDTSGGTFADLVTVTEVVPAGYTVSWVKTQQIGGTVTTTNGTTATASGLTVDIDGGALIIFTNTADPEELGIGRFTGGGQVLVAGVRISKGLTIHCDLKLSNNLEVNWNGNKFHMIDHLETIECSDDPAIIQAPPPAPLDTMIGRGVGKYNGTDGYIIEFTFVDYGEPGSEDQVALKIYAPGSPGSPVLSFPLTTVSTGNLQAHFDQPHK